MRRHLVLKLLCVLGILCLASETHATMKALTTEKLTRASKVIVVGKVQDLESRWTEDGEKIITRAAVTVTRLIRGKMKSSQVLVEYEGGEVGEIGMKVSDVSPLKKNERVLLFLKPRGENADSRVFSIVGKAQGKYTIHEDGVARRRGFALAGKQIPMDNDIPLEELIRKIEAVADENFQN